MVEGGQVQMSDKYILKGHEPVPCNGLLAWCRWFEDSDAERIVKQEMVGDIRISTVFLGLDQRLLRDRNGGQPLLFETLVRGSPHDDGEYRYSNWDEAAKGHEEIAAKCRATQ